MYFLVIKKIFKTNIQNKIYHQFYNCSVTAGFPSPADDYLEDKLDLNEYLIKHPAATFFVRVAGDSMINAGIYNNDIIIVDILIKTIISSFIFVISVYVLKISPELNKLIKSKLT